MTVEILFTFPNTRAAIAGERALLRGNFPAQVMPMPEALGDQCGIVLRLPADLLEPAQAALLAAEIPIHTIYQKRGEEIIPLT
ncbi:MAG: DUF3343 domain-containing protein [Oscillospiraceae bacterium]|nr:DUF3343 domain-containing protein [Oscillospiraceae bacterium]